MSQEWKRATCTIDPLTGHTQANIINAFESFLTQTGWERASWSGSGTDRHYLRIDRTSQPRWQYTGDGEVKYGGIRVFYDAAAGTTTGQAEFSGQKNIVIQSFLQAADGLSAEIATQDFIARVPFNASTTPRMGTVRLVYDNTVANYYQFVGGEDGLYVECGTSPGGGLPTNLGHGAILTFGAIPEMHSAIDHTVQWTAQGLVADFFGPCRFTEDRNMRFVSNDVGTKNFTAGLQPQSPRGTYSLSTPQIQDRRAYYIGSRDSLLGMACGAASESDTTAVPTVRNVGLAFHASFGLINSPENSRYRISPLMMAQTLKTYDCSAISTSAGDVAPTSTNSAYMDPRAWRQIFRFAALDYTLLPGLVTDAVTGLVYRAATVADASRPSMIGVEWSSQVVTLTL